MPGTPLLIAGGVIPRDEALQGFGMGGRQQSGLRCCVLPCCLLRLPFGYAAVQLWPDCRRYCGKLLLDAAAAPGRRPAAGGGAVAAQRQPQAQPPALRRSAEHG
ncbi:hypothetical protein ABEW34_29450, partial [Paenibacillus algorifonticola]|uniref:hypothetical protein n=1 Tax=Paenibacillus algorifonticola TaxID=684063 RepID=UPI003D2C4BC9